MGDEYTYIWYMVDGYMVDGYMVYGYMGDEPKSRNSSYLFHPYIIPLHYTLTLYPYIVPFHYTLTFYPYI